MDNTIISLTGVVSGSGTISGALSPGQIGGGGGAITLQEKTVTLNTTEQAIEPDDGYDGLSLVTVPGVSLQAKTVALGASQQVITADAGYDGLGSVTVPALSLQDKNVTLTSSQQVITADAGYDGLGSVTVPAESGGGGTDTINDLLNDGVTERSVTMTDAGGHACNGLRAGYTVTLPNTVTSIVSSAFYNDGAVRSVTGQTVTTVGDYAFQNASRLRAASFPNVLTVGDYAFANTAIESFVANSIGSNGLSEGAFQGCQNLESARFGNSLMSIPDSCFDSCSNLLDLWLGGPPPTLGSCALETGGAYLNVHVRSTRLSDYQNNAAWQAYVQEMFDEYGMVVSFVGDFT